jgi:outer membrane protein assembly factor BamD (BamD/ComL family)
MNSNSCSKGDSRKVQAETECQCDGIKLVYKTTQQQKGMVVKMKKEIILHSLVFFFFTCMLFIGCASSSFKNAQKLNTIEAYEKFIEKYPTSDFLIEAQKKVDDLKYENAKKSNTIEAYRVYIDTYGKKGQHFEEAVRGIDKIKFEMAKQSNDIKNMIEFINNNQNSFFMNDAKKHLDYLIYKPFMNSTDISALNKFIEENPDNENIQNAKNQIVELEYNNALMEGSIQAIKNFILKYPKTTYTQKILVGQAQNKKIDKVSYWVELLKINDLCDEVKAIIHSKINELNRNIIESNIVIMAPERDLLTNLFWPVKEFYKTGEDVYVIEIDGKVVIRQKNNEKITKKLYLPIGKHKIKFEYPWALYEGDARYGEAYIQEWGLDRLTFEFSVNPLSISYIELIADSSIVSGSRHQKDIDRVRYYHWKRTYNLRNSYHTKDVDESLSENDNKEIDEARKLVSFINQPPSEISNRKAALFYYAYKLSEKHNSNYPLYLYWLTFYKENDYFSNEIVRNLSKRKNVYIYAKGLPFVSLSSYYSFIRIDGKERHIVLAHNQVQIETDIIKPGLCPIELWYKKFGNLFESSFETTPYSKELLITPFDTLKIICYDGQGFKFSGVVERPKHIASDDITAYIMMLKELKEINIPEEKESFETQKYYGNPLTLGDIKQMFDNFGENISAFATILHNITETASPDIMEKARKAAEDEYKMNYQKLFGK